MDLNYRSVTVEVLTELVQDYAREARSLIQAHTAAICEVSHEARVEAQISPNRRTVMEQEADLSMLDHRIKLARSKLKVAQRELDQYEHKGAPLPLPVATANSKPEIAAAITSVIESSSEVQEASRATRRVQADSAMLRGELASAGWSQQMHHLTPVCLPDDRFMELLRSCNVPVEIVDTGRRLPGYKLWVVDEWIFSSTRKQCCVVQKSDNPSDTIEVDVIKLSASATPEQNKFLWTIFGESALSGGWIEENDTGALAVMAKDAKTPAGLTLTAVPDGNLRAHYDQLSLQLCLKQLSCGVPALSVGELSSGTRVVFRSLYGVRAEDDFTSSISVLLNETECLLALLGLLPWSAGAEEQRSLKNHSYSDVLLAAIRGFQVESNTLTSFRAAQREAAAVSEFTREDGHLDPMTLNALRQRYAECETRLRDVKGVALPFPSGGHITQGQTSAVRQELMRFQVAQNLNRATGSFDRDTLMLLGVETGPADRSCTGSDAAALAHSSHRQDIFGDSTLNASNLASTNVLLSPSTKEKEAFPKSWMNYADEGSAAPEEPVKSTPRQPTPMQKMDACTPLSPRTRLSLGFSDINDTSVISSTPNQLFGSHLSPIGSPDPLISEREEAHEFPSSKRKTTLPEQVAILQAELAEQRERADTAVAKAAQANAETEALRAAVTALEAQVKAMPQYGSTPSSPTSNLATTTHTNPGMVLLDVLGVLWLKEMVTGK